MTDGYDGYALPAGAQIPESVKARLMAARLLQQSGAAQTGPYSSGAVTAVKALSGLLGGLQEGAAMRDVQQGTMASRQALLALSSALRGYGAAGSTLSSSTPATVAAAPSPAAIAIPGSAPTSPSAPISGDASRDLAIRTIYGEAGGEPDVGKAGVAAVLKNRLAGGQYGSDMQSVILAPKQFSLWNQGDPAGASARRLDPSSAAYQRIGQIYDGVLAGDIPDPTGGATHYYNPHVANPSWGPQLARQNDVTIGNHRFVGTGPAGPNGASPQAQADMPVANARPVASDMLPPGITSDMVSGQPSPQPSNPQAPSPFNPAPMASQGGITAPPRQLQNDPDAQKALLASWNWGMSPAQGFQPAPAAPSTPQDATAPDPQQPSAPVQATTTPLQSQDQAIMPGVLGQDSNSILRAPSVASVMPTPDPGSDPNMVAGLMNPVPMADQGNAGIPPATGVMTGGNATPSPADVPPLMPQTGPMPPPGAQSLAAALRQAGPAQSAPLPPPRPSDAALGLNPDAPAPNATPTSGAVPPALMAQMLRQPNSVPGNSAISDPSSPQNFTDVQANGGVPPSVMSAALRGKLALNAPPQGDGNLMSSLFSLTSGGSSMSSGGGIGPMLGEILGGGQSQGRGGMLGGLLGGGSPSGPSAPPIGVSPGSAGGSPAGISGASGQAQAAAAAILGNMYSSPAQVELAGKILFPQMSISTAADGRTYAVNPMTGESRMLFDGGAKFTPNESLYQGGRFTQAPDKPMDVAPGHSVISFGANNQAVPQTQVAPTPEFTATRDGVIYNKNTGQLLQGNGATGWRMMTPEEKQAAGIPLDQPMQIGPNGKISSGTGQTINVGGEQNVYDTDMAKAMAQNHVGLMQGIDANRTKLRDLNLMSGAIQRLQQNGGTTGLGAEEMKDLQSAVNTGANTLGLGQQFDVSDKEVIGKVARQISGAAAKDIGGARTTNFDMQQMLEANPGLALSPTGNQRMLGIAQQVTQRNIDIGQAMQNAAAAAVQQGRRVNPQQMEQIRADYDAAHHIVDPITGQDLSVSPNLPEFHGGGQPQGARPPASAGPATSGVPVAQTAVQQGTPAAQSALQQAQAAIARGAPRASVIQRLQSIGIDPAGL